MSPWDILRPTSLGYGCGCSVADFSFFVRETYRTAQSTILAITTMCARTREDLVLYPIVFILGGANENSISRRFPWKGIDLVRSNNPDLASLCTACHAFRRDSTSLRCHMPFLSYHMKACAIMDRLKGTSKRKASGRLGNRIRLI